ncbi:MAG: 30S ribosomal protein S20 [Limnochordia bacterium]|jgi:small subunit ribosomal protein S20|nr:30S ribosomal protein S20 [Limnochordia bacterium]MDD2628561.1 30S ribosomal protein S20 [Limnochordia bacterium]MDD4517446.1 30S ribosomal protein S20 [Limnochordia bacterium]
MANTPSAKKRIKVAERRSLRNKSVQSGVKTAIRKYQVALENQPENAPAYLSEAVSLLDKAASKGVIHPNKAARRKSRLTKALNKVQ